MNPHKFMEMVFTQDCTLPYTTYELHAQYTTFNVDTMKAVSHTFMIFQLASRTPTALLATLSFALICDLSECAMDTRLLILISALESKYQCKRIICIFRERIHFEALLYKKDLRCEFTYSSLDVFSSSNKKENKLKMNFSFDFIFLLCIFDRFKTIVSRTTTTGSCSRSNLISV